MTFQMCYAKWNSTNIMYTKEPRSLLRKMTAPKIIDPKPITDETVAGAPTFDEGLEFAPLFFVKKLLNIK